MDCFMIGNGFDLHYGLPTAYSSFLLVVDYLCRLSDSGRAVSSVSQVISSEELRNSDRAIRNCYNLYGDYYDAPLGDEVSKLVLSANNNFWFTYLRESHRLHPNWIDFEKEIDLVLHTLSKCFDMVYNVKEQLIIETQNKEDAFILKKLPHIFIYNGEYNGEGVFRVDRSFISANPAGSDNFIVDRGKISESLYISLRIFGEMLSTYLYAFAVKPLDNLVENAMVKKDYLLSMYDNLGEEESAWRARVISFNYTRTWEKLYPYSLGADYRPKHIHGCLTNIPSQNIVLGINSDNADKLGSIDTTFLQFKKYYQRIFLGTDQLEYETIDSLFVIGHSLDTTDQEIITELFERASRITIYYHDLRAKQDYICNLITMFGKDGLEKMIREKSLRLDEIEKLNEENTLPKYLTIFQLLNIQKAEDLDLAKRWNRPKSLLSLSAPIGVSKSGVVNLDILRENRGSLGLVCGSRGTGKSELLATYILSMATLYHPSEVGFLIIDYKDAGIAYQLQGLPHIRGVVPSLDCYNITRFQKSIHAELRRRQQIMLHAGVNQIEKYFEKYKDHLATEPMPHLIIIVDEFAKVKSVFPEFLEELVSLARTGRKFGIHLVLSTQNPAGVVDDSIRAASQFRMCFKVRELADSMEMLRSPLATKIIEPGRAYLQLGRSESVELVQCAYSDAPEPAKKSNEHPKNMLSQTSAIISHIRKYYKANEGAKIIDISLSPLPNSILIPPGKSRDDKCILADLGIYDDPLNQSQGIYSVNMCNQNVLLIGTARTGKTNALQVIIRSIAMHYSPSEVFFYIIDFSSLEMKCFEKLCHVGGVVTPSEEERLATLFAILNKEIELRKRKLVSAGLSSFAAYKETGGTDMPLIILIVDNLTAMKELYPKYSDMLHALCRTGSAVGVRAVIANSRASDFSSSFLINFSCRIALFCNDSNEYSALFDYCRERIEDIPGRSLVEINNNLLECQLFQAFSGSNERNQAMEIQEVIAELNSRYKDDHASLISLEGDQ